jgi:hypothetical protein
MTLYANVFPAASLKPLIPPISFLLRLALAALISFTVATAPLQPAANPQPHARLLQFMSNGRALGFAPGSMYVASGSHALRVEYLNAEDVTPISAGPGVETEAATPLRQVTYTDLWPGITLTYDAVGIVRSTYRLEPGADASDIRLRYSRLPQLQADGSLRIEFETGALMESAPVAWQEVKGHRAVVDVAFVKLSDREVGFAVGVYDPAHPLFIDPTLQWNSFLGGAGADQGNAIAVDGNGNVYVAGHSDATWGAPVQAFTGLNDAFVAKLDNNGALLWSTFLGGAGDDQGIAVAVDGGGNVYVAGYSDATWGAPVRAYTGGFDSFAAKLNNNGALLWNTFLGGAGADHGRAIAVDGVGNVYLAGYGEDWGAPVRPFSGNQDAFAAKLNNNGALLWNTFLGGAQPDQGYAIAVDGGGNVYAAGDTDSGWGTPLRAYTANDDAFVAQLNGNGALQWNTFLGGAGNDFSASLALDGAGNVYITGHSGATWGAPIQAFTGDDAYAAKLGNNGALLWNTFLGGAGFDWGYAVKADGIGSLYVAGYSNATWGAPVQAFAGANDAFAAKLNSNGAFQWNTFLGGTGSDIGRAVAVDGGGNVYAAGDGDAAWGAPIRAYTAGNDAFVAKLVTPQVAVTTPAVAAAYVLQGTTNHVLYRLTLTPNVSVTLTGVTVTTGGTYQTTDLTANSFKLRYSADTTLDAGDATLNAQAIAASGSNLAFTGLSQAIAASTTGYLFVTADIDAAAVSGRTINIVAVALANITFTDTAAVKTGAPTTGGLQIIGVAPPPTSTPSSPTASPTETAPPVIAWPTPESGQAVGSAGGTFSCEPWFVIIPANTVPDGSTLHCGPFDPNVAPTAPDGLQRLNHPINAHLYNHKGGELKTFASPIQMCYRYRNADVDKAGEAVNFVIITAPPINGTWSELSTTVNITDRHACGATTHFTLFEVASRELRPEMLPETGNGRWPWWMILAALAMGVGVGLIRLWTKKRLAIRG